MAEPEAVSCGQSNLSGGYSGNKPRDNQATDSFDGDDLQLNDFLPVNPRKTKQKEPAKEETHGFDDVDWLSIDSTPTPPRRRLGATQSKPEWATDMGPQDQEEDESVSEPVRLPNGNWTCNHKCKDKTRYVYLLLVVFQRRISVNFYSCKHFCCREGLEKPPRPSKKRAPANPKETSNLSQLTLPATMKKKDALGNSSNEKAPKNVKSRAIENEDPKVTQFGANGNRKVSIPSTDQKRPENPPKQASSDYGDDAFDDLSPPPWMYGNNGSSFARPDAPVASDVQPEDTNVAFVDLTTPCDQEELLEGAITDFGPGTEATTGASEATEPQATQTQENKEGQDDPTSQFECEIFTNPFNLTSSATTMPLSSVDTNVPRNPKRKASTIDECLDQSNKKQEHESPKDSIEEAHVPLRMPVRFTMKDFENTPSPVSDEESTGWDDVDRLLLEEFKDIVNFF